MLEVYDKGVDALVTSCAAVATTYSAATNVMDEI